MNTLMKASCLAIYLISIVASFAIPSSSVTSVLQIVAIILLAGHGLELLIALGSVKRYAGPLVDSIGLTLLFGFLHWWPLRKERPEQVQGQPR
jgi:uncharacterized protein YhhL (DUF1145 family)